MPRTRNLSYPLRLPGTDNSSFLNRLPPQMRGTDTYQAGVDQSQAAQTERAVGALSATGAKPGSLPARAGNLSEIQAEPAYPVANNALRSQQDAALVEHAMYRQRLVQTQDMVNTRNQDLRLAQNMLIATDPNVDKSVRKFMLRGLSQSSGVDPNGEYSKQIQAMVLGMQPESLEALRSTFGADIATAEPGSIQKKLGDVFNGNTPVENLIAEVKRKQQADAAAGNAATAPGLPVEGASASGAAPIPQPENVAAVDAATVAAGEAAGGGASITPQELPPSSTPRAVQPAAPSETALSEPQAPIPPDLSAPAETASPPDFGVINIPQHWRDAAEKTGDELAQKIIESVDKRNAVINSSTFAKTSTPTATPTETPTTDPSVAAAGQASGTPTPTPAEAADAAATSAGSAIGGVVTSIAKPVGKLIQSTGDAITGNVDQPPTDKATADAAIALTSPDKPVTGPGGVELPQAAPSGRKAINDQVAELNANAQPAITRDRNLNYVKPEERDIQNRPVPRDIANSLPNTDPRVTYHFGHLKEIYPKLDDSTEYRKEFSKLSKDAQTSAVDVAESSLDLAKLVDIAQKGGQIGGLAIPKIPIPMAGNLEVGNITPGTLNRMWQNVRGLFASETKVSDGVFDQLRSEAQKFSAKQLAGVNLSGEDKAVLTTLLEAGFLRNAFALARANNNGGKQITDKDLQFGMAQGGSITATGPQNIALLKQNTDRALQSSGEAFANHVGNPNVGVNWDAMTSQQRQSMMQKHIELGNKSPLSPETFKDISQAEADFQRMRKGGEPTDPNRYIQRSGLTEEAYRNAQQQELTVKRSAEEETRRQKAESHALEMQKYVDAKLKEQRAEAEAQRKQIAQAFQHFATALQGGRHGISMPAMPSGGEQDTGAFRMTPAPSRSAPRITPANIQQRALPKIR